MASGLQVWDSNGVLIVDTSTLLPRAIDIGSFDNSGSVNIPMLASTTNVAVPVVDTTFGFAPEVTISNTGTVAWNKRNNRDYNARISVMLL
ncbi:hypothetical protein [Sphingomonas faeni]|uniref:hypothetical protein n=1 Tax=Sphingomonas faeni TaxID=185950 RepID=UPI0011B20E3D|nr:hypothetical protein [Sphingomonas faeni]